VVGTAAIKASARKTGQLLAGPFRNEPDRAAAAERADEDVAKILFNACAVLRGTALKLAQVLATEYELLPPALREQFARAAHDAIPINRVVVHRIIKNELGDWRQHFREFSDVPFAAASLGQVHAATGLGGEALAVKIQYPGVAEGIHSDLSLARAVLAPTRWGTVFESCFDELRDRLDEELDYEREAEHTEWFKANVRNPLVRIPSVYREHSTRHVLVTERMPGRHLSDWLATQPSLEMRERYGQLLVDLFHECAGELNCIHADPNFGNYLFGDAGQLGVIDFGCVRRLDPAAPDTLRRVQTISCSEPDVIERMHLEMGVRYRQGTPRDRLNRFLASWSDWIFAPYRSDRFDFGDTDYFERGAALQREARELIESCDGAFLYFGRAQQGLYRMLQTLGVAVRMRWVERA
jgi:predicted unusual protein kinase regulating ubiquinone biosynthesis (AarF/ABC1/UbiB family)